MKSYGAERTSLKRIIWFAFHHEGSSSVRYRGRFPLQWMEQERGVRSLFVVPGYAPEHLARFLRAYVAALIRPRRGTLVVIQRVRSRFLYASALKLLVWLRPQGTAYDLDDADYLEHPPDTIHWFAKRCATVHAGSAAIQDHMRRLNQQARFITSPVVQLGVLKRARNPRLAIGWVGDHRGGHEKGLRTLLVPALRMLDIPVRLVLIGVERSQDRHLLHSQLAGCDHVEIVFPDPPSWTDERWLQERIAEFDVGIATLDDTPIHRAKSGIKTKQYMNVGVPVLSVRLPENDRFVRHGVNGFLFDTPLELARYIKQVNDMDPMDYDRLMVGARASVHHFDHARYFNLLEASVRGEYLPMA